MTPAQPTPGSNIEVLILTYNEEQNLPHALASVRGWASNVWVVDSGSTDATRRIAEEAGAKFVERPWLGYAQQKNWALDTLPFKSDWIFILDADEAITPELRKEILAVTAQLAEEVRASGYYVNRLFFFLGRPIRHCGYFPSYNLRFFKRGKARYEQREVHEHMIVDGPTDRLSSLMLHEDRRGLEHLIAKHNRYSTLEARELARQRWLSTEHETTPHERGIALRRWLKRHVLPRLPFSGVFRFFYMYVLRLGFLDGAAGLRFCTLLATYDRLISLKLAELRSLGADRAPDRVLPPRVRGLAVAEGELGPSMPAAARSVAPGVARAPQAPGASPSASSPVAQPPAQAPVRPTVVVPETEKAPARAGKAAAMARHPEADALAAQHHPTHMPPGQWPALGSVPVSILVPVKNEQRNIVHCLRRVQWATELVVVDSQSTDQTIALSQAMGADVYQFHYSKEGWPKKKNWALEQVPWKNDWVMILDADEYMTPELAEEIRQVVAGTWKPTGGQSKQGCGDGFWVNRRFMFFGRWLRGCGYYPSYNVRLFKHGVGRYERIGSLGDTGSGDNEVHEHVVLDTGEAGYLRNEFLHYAYPDLSAWIEKHNRYTTWEAHAMEAKDAGGVRPSMFGGPIERRRWLKRFARRLPLRPTLRFIYSYVFQMGFRDGYPGYVMCRLLGWYEFVSIAKYRERRALESERAREEAKLTSGRSL